MTPKNEGGSAAGATATAPRTTTSYQVYEERPHVGDSSYEGSVALIPIGKPVDTFSHEDACWAIAETLLRDEATSDKPPRLVAYAVSGRTAREPKPFGFETQIRRRNG